MNMVTIAEVITMDTHKMPESWRKQIERYEIKRNEIILKFKPDSQITETERLEWIKKIMDTCEVLNQLRREREKGVKR